METKDENVSASDRNESSGRTPVVLRIRAEHSIFLVAVSALIGVLSYYWNVNRAELSDRKAELVTVRAECKEFTTTAVGHLSRTFDDFRDGYKDKQRLQDREIEWIRKAVLQVK